MAHRGGFTQTYYELLERFQQMAGRPEREACPVCQLSQEAVKSYLALLSYERVNEMEERDRLRAAAGFCNRHVWQWHALNDALGTAFIYGDIARSVTRKLTNGELAAPNPNATKSGLGGFMAKALGNAAKANHPTAPGTTAREDLGLATCPACLAQNGAERRVLDELVLGLGQDRFREAYASSAGLCLPHVSWASELISAPADREWLITTETAFWSKLAAELNSVIEKMNFSKATGRQEIGPESLAVRRSIWKAAGLKEQG